MWVLFKLNNSRLKKPLDGSSMSPESFIVNERSGMFPIEDHHTLTKEGDRSICGSARGHGAAGKSARSARDCASYTRLH